MKRHRSHAFIHDEEKSYNMRVAHIIKVTRISGAERHLLVLVKGLRQQNIDAQLIILVEPGNPMDDMIAEANTRAIPIHRVTIHRDYDLTVIFRLRTVLRQIKPDIIHTHLIHADLFGFLAGKTAGVRTIISSRHNDDHFRYHPLLRRVSQVLWWLSDGGIAISSAIRDFTIHIEGASPDKVKTVRYGLEYRWIPDDEINAARHKIRDELNFDEDTILLGMVCRLVEQKGILYALYAFKQVIEVFPEAHLIIAGDGDIADELRLQARILGLVDSVHWLGWRDDAQTVIAAMDIFLMPSLWEGFGLVLLEAMSRRVPIVASRVSAIPEVVDDGVTGLLVTPRAADELSEAIMLLLQDRSLRKHMGLLGEDRLELEFGVGQMVGKTLAAYRQYMH